MEIDLLMEQTQQKGGFITDNGTGSDAERSRVPTLAETNLVVVDRC